MKSVPNEIERAIKALTFVDPFHGPDPIETVEAVKSTIEGWRALLDDPETLVGLLSTEAGRGMAINSADVILACLARVMRDLAKQRLNVHSHHEAK